MTARCRIAYNTAEEVSKIAARKKPAAKPRKPVVKYSKFVIVGSTDSCKNLDDETLAGYDTYEKAIAEAKEAATDVACDNPGWRSGPDRILVCEVVGYAVVPPAEPPPAEYTEL